MTTAPPYADADDRSGPLREPHKDSFTLEPVHEGMTIAQMDERLAELAHVRSIGLARGEVRPTTMDENALLDARLILMEKRDESPA